MGRLLAYCGWKSNYVSDDNEVKGTQSYSCPFPLTFLASFLSSKHVHYVILLRASKELTYQEL